MEKKRIGINGFGRIGRVLCRVLSEQENIEIVGINDIHPIETMTHLLKYDSTHGPFPGEISHDDSEILVNNSPIKFFSEKDPQDIPWSELEVDIVVEATGLFKSKELAGKHLKAGAKKVIISAPTDDQNIDMVVLGVNDSIIQEQEIISNASCTTNNAAPMIQIVDDLCEIECCYITTVHSYTGDQKLQDSPHKDLRRGRAAAQSIVPTTTGAAKALTRIFPQISDVIGGCGIRVPVIDGSLTDITFVVKNPVSAEALNEKFKEEAEGSQKGIIQYSDEPLVSRDIIGNTHSCVFDSELTSVIGKMVKVVGWYDNEVGYSNRLLDLINRL